MDITTHYKLIPKNIFVHMPKGIFFKKIEIPYMPKGIRRTAAKEGGILYILR